MDEANGGGAPSGATPLAQGARFAAIERAQAQSAPISVSPRAGFSAEMAPGGDETTSDSSHWRSPSQPQTTFQTGFEDNSNQGQHDPAAFEAHKSVNDWLNAGELDQSVGSFVARGAGVFSERWANMTEAQQELAITQAEIDVVRIFGSQERADVMLEHLGSWLDEMETVQPKMTRALRESELMYSPELVVTLAGHAERLHYATQTRRNGGR